MSEQQITQLEQQAATLLNNRQLSAAQKLYEQICTADNTNADAWMKLGIIHGIQNNHSKAAECLNKSLALNPNSPDNRLNLAHALLQLGHWEAAEEQCTRVIREKPAAVTAWSMLGRSHAERQQYEKAIEANRQALHLRPDLRQALVGLGFALYHLDRWEESLEHFRHALRIAPNLAQAHFGLGSSLLKMRNLQEALHHMSEAARLGPNHGEAHLGVGTVLSLMGRQQESVAHLRKAIQLQPNLSFAYITLAATLMTLSEPEEAQQLCNHVLAMEPDNIEAISLATTIDQHLGDIDKAHERLKPLIESGNRDVNVALAYSTICSSLGETATGVDYMKHILRDDRSITGTGRLNLHFNLGKLYDKQKDYKQAFEHYRRGNEIKHAEFDPQQQTAETDTLIAIHTRALQDTLPRATQGSDRPVFIIGMPRSGTSLTEQILASHPDIFGAGELPNVIRISEWLNKATGQAGYPLFVPHLAQQLVDDAAQQYLDHIATLSPDAARVVDKMPGNFMFIGLIELLFPNARIIHTRRNPLDTCLSCYFQNFSRSHPYSYDLANLGVFYRNYERTMQHWRDTISLPMLEVQYEDMIADQEAGSRRIVEFCGLEWDEQCMDFHKTERYVATASYDQVRQPIYKSSVSRWKNYEEYIGPLIDALK